MLDFFGAIGALSCFLTPIVSYTNVCFWILDGLLLAAAFRFVCLHACPPGRLVSVVSFKTAYVLLSATVPSSLLFFEDSGDSGTRFRSM